MFIRLLFVVAALGAATLVWAEDSTWTPPAVWTEVVKPVHITGPVYYVGSRELSSYLLVDNAKLDEPDLILVNIGMPENVDLVFASIRELGFNPKNIKYLLITQAHFDHAGGVAEVQRRTQATVVAGHGDVGLMQRGGKGDHVFDDQLSFPAVANIKSVNDGDLIELGKLQLTTISTPGHTPGSSSWIMTIDDDPSGPSQVLLMSSMSVLPDAVLVENPRYPLVIRDFQQTFKKLNQYRPHYLLPDHLSFLPVSRETLAEAPLSSAWFRHGEALGRMVTEAKVKFERHLNGQRVAQ